MGKEIHKQERGGVQRGLTTQLKNLLVLFPNLSLLIKAVFNLGYGYSKKILMVRNQQILFSIHSTPKTCLA